MKHREEHARIAFDEERALDDLQTLQREIQRARGDRERAEAEFDAFLRGFRTREGQRVSKETRPSAPEDVPERPKDQRRPVPEVTKKEEQTAPVADPAPVEPTVFDDEPLEAGSPVETVAPPAAFMLQRRRTHAPLIVTIAAVAAIGVVFAVRGRRVTPVPADVSSRTPVTSAPETPAPDAGATGAADTSSTAPTASTTGPASQAAGVKLEITTRRPVWVRITVDGRRAVERELPAGERIPLLASRSILIRAGDAGAVVVRRSDGAESPLGGDGIVATREFTADSSRAGTPVR